MNTLFTGGARKGATVLLRAAAIAACALAAMKYAHADGESTQERYNCRDFRIQCHKRIVKPRVKYPKTRKQSVNG